MHQQRVWAARTPAIDVQVGVTHKHAADSDQPHDAVERQDRGPERAARRSGRSNDQMREQRQRERCSDRHRDDSDGVRPALPALPVGGEPGGTGENRKRPQHTRPAITDDREAGDSARSPLRDRAWRPPPSPRDTSRSYPPAHA